VTLWRSWAWKWEGVGLPPAPPRDPAHANPQWFELDSDEEIDDPDAPAIDPLPTERHRRIPDLPTI